MPARANVEIRWPFSESLAASGSSFNIELSRNATKPPYRMATFGFQSNPKLLITNVTLATAIVLSFCPFCGTSTRKLLRPSTLRDLSDLAERHSQYSIGVA
ncbi:hypothetical protein JQ617_27290 [Bradyrhizobium sp. KB893862 SZCCT0404]|uniref:hypothetical protein n=1 Tax=Bradyrhizobium sp. KB893862 SZCCT0404 TaxID=2807672 RepID=UPI001BA52CFC|nr:hypothetical protein [Bradyrhizobium sp. KB893862 SZCCT0404]MBR1177691.1 hypothetical protein [Bradyrhizobium sp. KB893862 SZCCT0404]